MNSKEMHRTVRDLGMAAYLKMQGFELVTKVDRGFVFRCTSDGETTLDEFEAQKIRYINGPFARFDSELMNLKKL